MKLSSKHRGKADQKEKNRIKKKGILLALLIIGAPVLFLTAVYMAGLGRYQSCFLNGTVIDEVDVSGMTIQELEEQIGNYSLRVIERQADGLSLIHI